MNYIRLIIMMLSLNTALSSYALVDPNVKNAIIDQSLSRKTVFQKEHATVPWPLVIATFVITGVVALYETKNTIADTVGCWWGKFGNREEVSASEQKPGEELGEMQSDDDSPL